MQCLQNVQTNDLLSDFELKGREKKKRGFEGRTKNEPRQNLQFINRKWQKFSFFDSAKKYLHYAAYIHVCAEMSYMFCSGFNISHKEICRKLSSFFQLNLSWERSETVWTPSFLCQCETFLETLWLFMVLKTHIIFYGNWSGKEFQILQSLLKAEG